MQILPTKEKDPEKYITFSYFCISFQCFQLIETSCLIYFTSAKCIVDNFQSKIFNDENVKLETLFFPFPTKRKHYE